MKVPYRWFINRDEFYVNNICHVETTSTQKYSQMYSLKKKNNTALSEEILFQKRKTEKKEKSNANKT